MNGDDDTIDTSIAFDKYPFEYEFCKWCALVWEFLNDSDILKSTNYFIIFS